MLSETPFLCLASVYAQELLDYLKQFDKDGKGALSKEELQEVMRGRIRCGWDLNILRVLGGQRGVPISREINTELMKCGRHAVKEGCLSVYGSLERSDLLPRPGSELRKDEVQVGAAWNLWWML